MLIPIFDFDYGGVSIYNLMGAVGVVFAIITLLEKEKRLKLSVDDEEKIHTTFCVAALLSIMVANLANWFLFPEIMNLTPLERITRGGLSFFYGMLGFLFVSALILKFMRMDYKFWINEIIPSILIFHAFGRIGCSLAGCCYGISIEPVTVLTLTVDRFPAREIEAMFLFALFFIFQTYIKNNRLQWYLFLYSTGRFLLEFGRGDNRGVLFINGISPAQITSVLVIITLSVWLLRKKLICSPK